MAFGRLREHSARALVALVCVCVLVFNLLALAHQRGVVATQHVQTAILAAEAGRPCPLTTQGATVCPFSAFSTGIVAQQSAPVLSRSGVEIALPAPRDERVPPARATGTPFRPPRTA